MLESFAFDLDDAFRCPDLNIVRLFFDMVSWNGFVILTIRSSMNVLYYIFPMSSAVLILRITSLFLSPWQAHFCEGISHFGEDIYHTPHIACKSALGTWNLFMMTITTI